MSSKNIKIILFYELNLRGYSTSTALFIAGFLTLLTICIFFVGRFLDANLASLSLQWTFLPWLSVFFLPALGMRAFGSRKASSDMNLLLSYPFLPVEIILGKWLSGLIILSQVLILTFPMALTIGLLGDPDWGTLIAGYIGAVFAFALMYAVAILASAISKEEVSAFLLGLFSLFVLVFLDNGALQITTLPDVVAQITRYTFLASPVHWLDEFAVGKLSLSAVFYFFALTAVCIFLACSQLNGYRQTPKLSSFYPIGSIVGLFVCAGLVGVIANSLNIYSLQLDLTDTKEYTFSPKTQELAGQSQPGTTIELYVSSDKSQIPQKIIKHMDRVERAIKVLEASSKGKISVSLKSLRVDSREADEAESKGITRVPMSSGDEFYFGLRLSSQNRSLTIGYIDVDRAASLEYDLALNLTNLQRSQPPRVAILSSVLKPSNIHSAHPGLSIISDLKRQYDVSILPYFADGFDEQYDVLIIFDAPIIRQAMLEAIDNHIQRGKSAIIMLDPFQRMNEANARLEIADSKEGEVNSIVDLLNFYGIEFSKNRVVGDFENAATVETASGRNFAYPYWIRMRKKNMVNEEPVAANLNELLFAEAGYFSANDRPNLMQPIVVTSERISTQNRLLFDDLSTEELALEFSARVQKPKVIVSRVNEKLPSPFFEHGSDNSDQHAFLLLIGDTDWLYDGFSRVGTGPSVAAASKLINDNHNFFLNLIELATGSQGLTEIRSRKSPVRAFSKIEAMLFESREKYHAKEVEFASNINSAEDRIRQFLQMANVRTEADLPKDVKDEILKIRHMIYPLKDELRNIRLQMRQNVNELFQTIIALNLITGPILSVVVLFIFRRYRRKSPGLEIH